MDYKRRDNYYIVDIIEKAIKTLNDKKGTKLRLTNATFDVGVGDKHGTEWHLDKTITASIEDTTNNKHMKLFCVLVRKLLRPKLARRQRRDLWS